MDDGIFGMDAQTIETLGIMTQHHGVIILQSSFFILLETITAPRVVVFLQTDNIRLLVYQIITYRLKAIIISIIATIAADIIRHQLDGIVWR